MKLRPQPEPEPEPPPPPPPSKLASPALLAGCLLVFLVAGWLRTTGLGEKVMHGDEANQAVKFGALLEGEGYRYDPVDHHGPTLYYLTFPAAWAAGAADLTELDEATVRAVPVAFGMALLVLYGAFAGGLGRGAVLAAAALAAVSPILVYFSRYYIQEMLLAFFTLGAVAAGWHYARRPGRLPAAFFGVSIGLMQATKETSIIAYAAMVAAALALAAPGWLSARGKRAGAGADRPAEEEEEEPAVSRGAKANDPAMKTRPAPATPGPLRRGFRRGHLAWAASAAAMVFVLFYSSFFTHWMGVPDALTTYFHAAGRAAGEGHEKPLLYYLQMLAHHYSDGHRFSEVLVLGLGLAGAGLAFAPRRVSGVRSPALARYLALFTAALASAYAIIPYKTPWLAIQFVAPLCLLGGVAAAWLLRQTRRLGGFWAAVPLAALLLGGLYHLGKQAHRGALLLGADSRNPYVYSHAVPDVLKLRPRLEAIAALHPDGRAMEVRVFSPEYWPIPWYLRGFSQVGFWLAPPPGDEPLDAPVVIVGDALDDAVTARLKDDYIFGDLLGLRHGLRDGINVHVYIRQDLWDRFMQTRQ